MSAPEHLNQVQFRHVPANPYRSFHTLTAEVGGKSVGELMWKGADSKVPVAGGYLPRAGEVSMIDVNKSHRGQGLAGQLIHRAAEIDPRLHHGKGISAGGRALIRSTPQYGPGRA